MGGLWVRSDSVPPNVSSVTFHPEPWQNGHTSSIVICRLLTPTVANIWDETEPSLFLDSSSTTETRYFTPTAIFQGDDGSDGSSVPNSQFFTHTATTPISSVASDERQQENFFMEEDRTRLEQATTSLQEFKRMRMLSQGNF